MWVKICGTTTLHDAQLAIMAGADAVGFVFAPSKRQMTVERVAAITAALPETLEMVGVFQQQSVEEIAAIVHESRLTAVQLHRVHSRAETASLRSLLSPDIKVLQVISCSIHALDETALRRELASATDDDNVWGVLLDASSRGASGGTGKSFDWYRVAAVLEEVWPQRQSAQGPFLIVAGGLCPENVREAIASLRPGGVDVVSGVEASPGVKSVQRLQAFLHSAKLESVAETEKPT